MDFETQKDTIFVKRAETQATIKLVAQMVLSIIYFINGDPGELYISHSSSVFRYVWWQRCVATESHWQLMKLFFTLESEFSKWIFKSWNCWKERFDPLFALHLSCNLFCSFFEQTRILTFGVRILGRCMKSSMHYPNSQSLFKHHIYQVIRFPYFR